MKYPCSSKVIAPLLGLGVLALFPATSQAGGILPNTLDYTYKLYSDQFSAGADPDTPMPTAYDGVNYYTAAGGNITSWLRQYDPITGDVVSSFQPGIDFRGLFSDASGTIYASSYASNVVYKMDSPGSFSTFLTLDTSTVLIDDQAPVVLSPDGNYFASRISQTINLWSIADGSYAGSLDLPDYGNVSGEALNSGGTNLSLAAMGSYWLTYVDGTDMVYAWDSSGNRVGDTQLLGNNNATAYGFGYANGYVFTNASDPASGAEYRGFALSSTAAPEPGTLALAGLGLVGLAVKRRRK